MSELNLWRETASRIRLAIQRDIPSLIEIERAGRESGCAWTNAKFFHAIQQRSTTGLVAEVGERVVGLMLYQLQRDHYRLRYLCVHPEFRRCNVACMLTDRLKKQLSSQSRTQIKMVVRETQLSLQLFLRSQGFVATKVLRRHFDDTGEDGYRMRYRP